MAFKFEFSGNASYPVVDPSNRNNNNKIKKISINNKVGGVLESWYSLSLRKVNRTNRKIQLVLQDIPFGAEVTAAGYSIPGKPVPGAYTIYVIYYTIIYETEIPNPNVWTTPQHPNKFNAVIVSNLFLISTRF